MARLEELDAAGEGQSRHVFVVQQQTIDTSTAWDLRPELLRALYAAGPVLWIDLGRVHFIDSTGLGMLVSLLKEARELEGGVRLVNAGREVRRLLQVTGLEALFELEAAQASIP